MILDGASYSSYKLQPSRYKKQEIKIGDNKMKISIKNVTLLSLALTLTFSVSTLMAKDNQTKRYSIESARISYEISGSGDVMGMMKTEKIGKKRLIFNQFGGNELLEEVMIEKRTQGGKTKTNKTHSLKYMKGSIIYSVDFKNKKVMRSKNQGMAMAQLFGGSNMAETGTKMLEKMGGKKTGSAKVAGYRCDIWELMGTKQCLYKGIPLKIESDIMGIKTTEIATQAKFGDITKKDFVLPDYPVFNMDMDRLSEGKKLEQLDKNKLDEMDQKAAMIASKETQEMQKVTNIMAQAAEQAGMKKGQKPTEVQIKAMQQNMENAAFPMMKKRFLEQMGLMQFGAKCLGAANTRAEANQCSKEAAKKFPSQDNDMEQFDKWNPAIKQEVLEDIKGMLKSADCVKASSNMQALQKCMPE